MLQPPKSLRLPLLPRCTPVDSSGNPGFPKPSAFPFSFKEPLSSHLVSISRFLPPSKLMFLTPLSLFFEWISCQQSFFPPLLLLQLSPPPLPLSHGTLLPYHFLSHHFINELAKQISIDADGCLSFIKAEVKVRSEYVCVGLRMIMKEKKKEWGIKGKSCQQRGKKVSAGRTFDFVVMENTKARGTDHQKTGHVSEHFKWDVKSLWH